MQTSRRTHMAVPGGPRALHRIHRAGRFDLVEVHRKHGVRLVRPDSKRQRVPSLHEAARRAMPALQKGKPAARVATQVAMDLGSADDSRWLLWSRAKEKSTICKVEGSFTVPEMPRNKGDQVIYISLGVEGSDGTLRTALQWGFNGGSGGPQWGFACWYEDLTGMGDDITVMSCLEPIETGDTLDVRIMRKTIADHTVWACHANARNTGPEATVSIVGDMSPNSCILGLEMYQADLNEPDQYPGSHTRFAKPTLRSSKRELKPLWKSGRHFPDGFPPDPRRPDLSVQNQKSAIVLRY